MEEWIAILLPFVLLMVRVAAFVAVSPIFGWHAVPAAVKAGLVLLLTVFFAKTTSAGFDPAGVHWAQAVVLMLQEAVIGLAVGLATRLVYSAVQQGGMIAAQQMGFADAGVIDPVSGSQARPIAAFFEICFVLFFLAAGGHHVVIAIIARSFDGFPLAAAPDLAALAEGLVFAGSTMLLFALKLAAPMLAGFVIMAVVLCILARVLPEMNILFASFPLRVGVGLFMAAATVPVLNAFTTELGEWMKKFLIA